MVYKVSETPQESDGEVKSYARYKYPNMSKTLGSFKLEVMEGDAARMRGKRPFGFTDLHRGEGVQAVIDFIVENGGLDIRAA